MLPITIRCWYCGLEKTIEVAQPPSMATDFMALVAAVGMKTYFDDRWGRVLAFCCEEHAKASLTKAGCFRKYPPKIEDEDAVEK